MSRFRRMELDTPEWGVVKLLVALPVGGDPWGALAPLRGTPWGEQIVVVPGETLSHATHGYVMPLLRVIGIDPGRRCRRIPQEDSRCALTDGCVGAGPRCDARSGDTPPCYEPIGVDPVATEVMLAWQEGRYVLVIDGPEFSL